MVLEIHLFALTEDQG